MRILELKKQGETLIFPTEHSRPDGDAYNEVRMAPSAIGPEPHIHLLQDELFQVVKGRFIGTIDGKEHVLEAGEEVMVKRGSVHTFRNGDPDQELVFKGKASPALHFEWMLVEMAKSAIHNGGSWKDLPLLEAGYVMHEMREEYKLAAIPAFIHGPLFALLHCLAKLTGAHRKLASKAEYYATVPARPEHATATA